MTAPGQSESDKVLSFLGLPYKGDAELINKDNQPKLTKVVHTAQFNLKKKKDLDKYNDIMQSCADELSMLSFEERVYDKELQSWRVLIRWFDLVYVANKKGDPDDI